MVQAYKLSFTLKAAFFYRAACLATSKLSVRPSVKCVDWIVQNRRKFCPDFYTI